nr:hypothetical protein [Nocardia exalbida]
MSPPSSQRAIRESSPASRHDLAPGASSTQARTAARNWSMSRATNAARALPA